MKCNSDLRTAVVVPTCRPDAFAAWWKAWTPHFGPRDDLIVVEDSQHKGIDAPTSQHYSHEEIRDFLGDAEWIVSKRDSAIRCFGYLMAWLSGYDLVVTLDDDCLPTASFESLSIGEAYHRSMHHHHWQESIPGMRTRGIPYGDLGTLESFIHVGLWSNVPDIDAVSALAAMGKGERVGGFAPPNGRRIMNDQQYFPMCGMNLAFRRDLVPAMYFPLMGEGQPYGRFDDIWAGVIAQRICRHLRMPVSVGEPHVEHRRASDPFANLKKEAPGIMANERLWRVIDACDLHGVETIECVQEMASHLMLERDEYTRRLGEAISVWASFFTDGTQLRSAGRDQGRRTLTHYAE